ncbi:class I SAM-dependent methyltransferase [Reichenbachiella versicolor]|uniref:class I SAM-dependent methyltransferase n=1 Tax=Reichenbachiella versicolor TaxID=1821036 RepID=UPI000D6E42FA|nr:class I SAM-dependent methyltransferase [Reichenbachiella versicolor]
MYEKIEICPSCNSKQFKSFCIADDHTVSQESFAIMQCINCNLLLTSPRPNKQSIGKYYQSEEYISHKNKGNNLTNRIYKVARWFTLRRKTKLLASLSEGRKILDYGCGAGTLLEHLNKQGWKTTGIEPDDETRQKIIEETDLTILKSHEDLNTKKFDIVTLWHVLEHVHDLNSTLKKLTEVLKRKGTLLIAVPNHNSHDREYYKENWAAYDVPRHLYHFTPDTITELLKAHKFKLKKTIPMKLDAYYVSLLSEKIATGKSNYLKAFIRGLISNKFAKQNNNYSSLIYVFKRS